ncbi:uncharacterized protein METZ01_LOCUS498735 [marine metagenome]|uniref:EF-hand domain-containing protein n=1 Tax=marine metagenome TaxID=408172 RepID=A0A383DN04_9ZZZZ
MKKFITLFIAGAIGLGSTFAADDEKKPAKGKKARPALTDEQKALMKEIKETYDADKDGKISKEERAKFTDEDKKRIKEAGIGPKKKGPPVSDELKAMMKEMREKYDADKDGKISQEERAKYSDEDKKRVREAWAAAKKDGPKKEGGKKGGKKGKGGKKKEGAEK